jgi:hypothetical protein
VTTVCLVGEPDLQLRVELLSRETSADALSMYTLTAPYENSVAVQTVSLGTAVAPAGAELDLPVGDARAAMLVVETMRRRQNQSVGYQRPGAEARPAELQSADALPATGGVGGLEALERFVGGGAGRRTERGEKREDEGDERAEHGRSIP